MKRTYPHLLLTLVVLPKTRKIGNEFKSGTAKQDRVDKKYMWHL